MPNTLDLSFSPDLLGAFYVAMKNINPKIDDKDTFLSEKRAVLANIDQPLNEIVDYDHGYNPNLLSRILILVQLISNPSESLPFQYDNDFIFVIEDYIKANAEILKDRTLREIMTDTLIQEDIMKLYKIRKQMESSFGDNNEMANSEEI